jgi:predicted Mrr-cat superfamily restriction endonuclease
MTRELNLADSTIRVLAIADFEKTKDLTNRFDRQEVRILAKMLVLRAVLGDDKTKTAPAADESDPG